MTAAHVYSGKNFPNDLESKAYLKLNHIFLRKLEKNF